MKKYKLLRSILGCSLGVAFITPLICNCSKTIKDNSYRTKSSPKLSTANLDKFDNKIKTGHIFDDNERVWEIVYLDDYYLHYSNGSHKDIDKFYPNELSKEDKANEWKPNTKDFPEGYAVKFLFDLKHPTKSLALNAQKFYVDFIIPANTKEYNLNFNIEGILGGDVNNKPAISTHCRHTIEFFDLGSNPEAMPDYFSDLQTNKKVKPCSQSKGISTFSRTRKQWGSWTYEHNFAFSLPLSFSNSTSKPIHVKRYFMLSWLKHGQRGAEGAIGGGLRAKLSFSKNVDGECEAKTQINNSFQTLKAAKEDFFDKKNYTSKYFESHYDDSKKLVEEFWKDEEFCKVCGLTETDKKWRFSSSREFSDYFINNKDKIEFHVNDFFNNKLQNHLINQRLKNSIGWFQSKIEINDAVGLRVKNFGNEFNQNKVQFDQLSNYDPYSTTSPEKNMLIDNLDQIHMFTFSDKSQYDDARVFYIPIKIKITTPLPIDAMYNFNLGLSYGLDHNTVSRNTTSGRHVWSKYFSTLQVFDFGTYKYGVPKNIAFATSDSTKWNNDDFDENLINFQKLGRNGCNEQMEQYDDGDENRWRSKDPIRGVFNPSNTNKENNAKKNQNHEVCFKKKSNNSITELYYGIAFTLKGDTEAKKRSAEDDEFNFSFIPQLIDKHTCLINVDEPKALITQNSHIIKDNKIYLNDMKDDIKKIYTSDHSIKGRTYESKDYSNKLKAFYQRVEVSIPIPAHSSFTLQYKLSNNTAFYRANELSPWGTHIANNVSIFKLPKEKVDPITGESTDPKWIPAVDFPLADPDLWNKLSLEQQQKIMAETEEQHLMSTSTHRKYQGPTTKENLIIALNVAFDVATIATGFCTFKASCAVEQLGKKVLDAGAKYSTGVLERSFATKNLLKSEMCDVSKKLFQAWDVGAEAMAEKHLTKLQQLLKKYDKLNNKIQTIIKYTSDTMKNAFSTAKLASDLCFGSTVIQGAAAIATGTAIGTFRPHYSKISPIVESSGIEFVGKNKKHENSSNIEVFKEKIVNNTNCNKTFYIHFGIGYVHNYQRTREVATQTCFNLPFELNILDFKFNN